MMRKAKSGTFNFEIRTGYMNSLIGINESFKKGISFGFVFVMNSYFYVDY